jgi:hypothetical protein
MTEPDLELSETPSAGPFELRSTTLGALPVIGRFLARMDLPVMLARFLPVGDPRTTLAAATVIGVVVGNLCVEREPLYGLAGWASAFEPGLLGLTAGESGLLNDDRVGRALDQLFDADRGSLLCGLVLHAIREFKIDTSQLHNDSTSCCTATTRTLTGASTQASRPSLPRAGIPRTIVPI